MSAKADEILKHIRESKIKPCSRWKFLLKDYLFWGLFGISTLIGAVAVSVIFFIVTNNDWDIYRYLGKSFLSYFLILMPYFWLVILVFLTGVAYFNYRCTRKGYLFNPYIVIFTSILISFILGGALFSFGMGEKVEDIFTQNIPYYAGVNMQKKILWSNPEKGLLAGEIIEIRNENNFSLKDLNYKEWEVVGDDIKWRDNEVQKIGQYVKIIGKIKDKNIFISTEVRPWGGHNCPFCAKDKKTNKTLCEDERSNGANPSGRQHSCEMGL